MRDSEKYELWTEVIRTFYSSLKACVKANNFCLLAGSVGELNKDACCLPPCF